MIISNITWPCNILCRIKAPASSASLPVSWTLLVLSVRLSICQITYKPLCFTFWLIFFADITVLQHCFFNKQYMHLTFCGVHIRKIFSMTSINHILNWSHTSFLNQKLFNQCWKLTNLWYNFSCSKSFYQHPGEDSLKWYPWFWLQLSFARSSLDAPDCSLEVVNRREVDRVTLFAQPILGQYPHG